MKNPIVFIFLISAISLCTVRCNIPDQLPTAPTTLSTTSTQSTSLPLFPLTTDKIIGLVLIFFIGGLANSTGVGGGMALTPILLIFFSYNENNAIAIVYALIFGAALGNIINVARRRDPKTGRPLINYELGILCMPLMLLGTNVGVVFGRMAAPLVIVLGLLGVAFYNLFRIFKRARKEYREETKQKKIRILSEDSHSGESDQRETNISGGINSNEEQEENDSKLQKVLKEENTLFPKKKLAILFALMLFTMLLAVIKGTQKTSSLIGVTYCGGGYWAIFAFGLVVCWIFSFFCQRLLKRDIRIKKEHGVPSVKGRFELAEAHMRKLTVLSLLAGFLAGLLAIGGGMILGPTFLSLGVMPQTLAATAGFFIVQTLFISLFQSALYGDVPLSELAFFLGIALVGSLGVSWTLSWLIKKYKRPSILLFLLIGVIILSIIVTPTFEIVTYWDDMGQLLHFNDIC